MADLQPRFDGAGKHLAEGVDEPVGRRGLLFDFTFVDDRLVLHERFAAEVRSDRAKGIV
ncbi:hypothetical protein D3C76_1862350 [compost metagenome]